MGNKVSIITRAYNRLEYTIKCVDSIKRNTNYEDYEHIIVNNNSTDGTQQWLDWVINSGIPHFKKLRGLHYDVNLGDWGGLLDASKYVHEDSKYYIQLDNDIEIPDPEWLNKLIYILENSKHKIVQLKRTGVKTIVEAKNIKTLKYNDEELKFGTIQRPVGCFILRTEDFKRQYPNLINTGFYDGKTQLSKNLGGTVKLINVTCNVMDGYTPERYLNYEKYPADLIIDGKLVIQEMK